jgi:hypothetical protein
MLLINDERESGMREKWGKGLEDILPIAIIYHLDKLKNGWSFCLDLD